MPRTTRPARSSASRRRLLKAGAIAIAVAATLAACTSTSSTANKSGTPNGQIQYWFAPNTPDAKGVADFMKYNITPFKEQYPQVQLQAVQKNVNTINQQIQVALSASKGPDIVTASGITNQITYSKAGYLTDLSSFAAEHKWSDTLLPWAQEVSKIDGKMVTLPQGYETLLLFYNKTLFEKNGWTPPTNRQEVEDLAAKMEAKGITPFAAGNSDYPAGTEWYVSTFFNDVAGASTVHDALTGKIDFTDQRFADSINLMKNYWDKGWFGGGVKKYFSTTDPQKYTQFASGQAGMYISGSWEFVTLPEYFKQAKSEFDWAPLPSLANGVPVTYPLSIGNTLSVNKGTTNAYAAESYLDWNLKDTKTMWAQVANTGADAMPVNIKPSDIPSNVDPRIARQYTALAAASEQGAVGYTTWTSWGGSSDQYIVDNTDKVLNGSLSTSDYLKGLSAAFKADVSKGNLPTVYSTGKSLG
ncbi:ABC transporter substrate-binding protein [Diaminobutyricibacter sp. McL0618]|uniref:ABC transporter substrate-binding protein n=1 Tax=Leifsonia sp. McL0618 TaxID=3415677 RepID=UPI003CE67217